MIETEKDKIFEVLLFCKNNGKTTKTSFMITAKEYETQTVGKIKKIIIERAIESLKKTKTENIEKILR